MSIRKIIHGQMIKVDANGDEHVLHQETSSSDVLVDSSTNTQKPNSTSAIPASVDNLQKLVDKLGDMAFKSKVKYGDLNAGIVVNNFDTAVDGTILDGRAGKNLNDRLVNIENADLLVPGEDEENSDFTPPETEINDNVVSASSTWSSEKINDFITKLEESHVFYIPLIENADGSYTSQKSIDDIEDAYQKNRPIWVVASDLFVPLRQRIDANNWLFSGYADGQAYDIKISYTGVTITYSIIVTADYDKDTDTVIFK
jgi:hypothetical protein